MYVSFIFSNKPPIPVIYPLGMEWPNNLVAREFHKLESGIEQVFEDNNNIDPEISVTYPDMNRIEVSNDNNMIDYIAKHISEVQEVEYVYSKFENSIYYIWTFIKLFDRSARRRIYAHQKNLIKLFPEYCFDFYVIALDSKPVSSLISGLDLIYSRS